MQKIVPFLWFDGKAEEATHFYVSIFENSKITNVMRNGDLVFGTTFEIDGQEFNTLNGGPQFKFTEAISLFVKCEMQEEIDDKWTKLTADGGEESMCGWLKDKYGLSWQIVPPILGKLLTDKNPIKANNVMQAMMKMKKIDIKALQEAYDKE